MDEFNSVPRASDNIYRSSDENDESKQSQADKNVSKQVDNSGMKRVGDRVKDSLDSSDDLSQNRDAKNLTRGVSQGKNAAKAAGLTDKGAGTGVGSGTAQNSVQGSIQSAATGVQSAVQGAVQGVVGAVKGAAVLAQAVPAAVGASIIGVVMAMVAVIAAVTGASTAVVDGNINTPVAYINRAAIGAGTSTDAGLISQMRRQSANRIYTLLGGFRDMIDWPDDYEGFEQEVTENYNGSVSTSMERKKIVLGLRPEQIFAVLGNWTTESGLDPTAVESIFDEPWMIGKDKQWAMSNDWVVELWANDTIGNKDYFEDNPLIHRCGIGLAQWTDVKGTDDSGEVDPDWKYDPKNPGRNSRLMRYAKLYGMKRYTDTSGNHLEWDSASGRLVKKGQGWNGEEWIKGDTTIEGFWYDLDVQMAFALDTSPMGDTCAQWLHDWSKKGSKEYYLFDGDKPIEITDDDFSDGELRGWRYRSNWYQEKNKNPLDYFTEAQDNSTGAYTVANGLNSLADVVDAVGDGTRYPSTFQGGEIEIDGYTEANSTVDTYYDSPSLPSGTTEWYVREYAAVGSYKRLGNDTRTVEYRINGGAFEIKYKDTRYNNITVVEGARSDVNSYTEVERIFSTATEGNDAIRQQAKVRAIDMANDMMQDFIGRWNGNRDSRNTDEADYDRVVHSMGYGGQVTTSPSSSNHVASWGHVHCSICSPSGGMYNCRDGYGYPGSQGCPHGAPYVTHYFIVKDSFGGGAQKYYSWIPSNWEEYYDSTGVHAQSLTNRDWLECFKYYYRKFLYEGMTAYFTAQFLVEYEGVPIGYEGRAANAMEYFDFWWDLASENTSNSDPYSEPNTLYRVNHMGDSILKTKGKGPNAVGFEDWFFSIEQPYARGLQIGMGPGTADSLTVAQQFSGKIYNADKVMATGRRTSRISNKALAEAACLIAWPTAADSSLGKHPEPGTALYGYIHDMVIPGDTYYASCDRSVATAVRWSGVDDNFPAGDTRTQSEYLFYSPNWVEIDWGGNYDMLQPGDIFIRCAKEYRTNGSVESGDTSHHIAMYVGEWQAEYTGKLGLTAEECADSLDVAPGSNVMHGAFGERTPGLEALTGAMQDYHVYRCMYPMAPGTSKYVQYHYSDIT